MVELPNLSIVIPIGPHEDHWEYLLDSIDQFIRPGEVILSVTKDDTDRFAGLNKVYPIKVVSSDVGRATQLNRGAQSVSREYLWCLHADSRLDFKAVREVSYYLQCKTRALICFSLHFYDQRDLNMRPQELGVDFRTRVLKMPFGDQGFLMTKEIYQELGGFREGLEYGEDHDFVWRWRIRGYRVGLAMASLGTSARKYRKGKWGVTIRYLMLSFVQAFPHFIKMLTR
jgi:GT2 family glycosyltransferase